MDEFQVALTEVVRSAPIVMSVLAAIGLATVVYLLWFSVKPVLDSVKPFIDYLASSKRVLATTWLVLVGVLGGGAVGFSECQKNMWFGAGISAVILAGSILSLYWVRQWVKWYHNEKE